jgi:alpha-L-fucosidase 2
VPAQTSILFTQPAKKWSAEALPLGNGRLGCMIFGGIDRERIQFNESSLWTGDRNPSGKYESMGAYQNFGDLFIESEGAPVDRVEQGSPQKPYFDRESVAASHDGQAGTKWCLEHGGKPVVWLLTLAQPKALKSYSFTACADLPERDPKTWQFEGSTDGQQWQVLDRRENQPPLAQRGKAQSFSCANTREFRHYRLNFLANQGGTHFQIAEITVPGTDFTSLGNAQNYRRELNLADALHTVTWTVAGVEHRREALASHPDEVVVVRLSASQPGKQTGRVKLQGAHQEITGTEQGDLVFTGRFPNQLEYQARVRVVAEGGQVKATADALEFSGCNTVTVFLAAGTSYVMDDTKNWQGPPPRARLLKQLQAASARTFAELKQRHMADYHQLYQRVNLDLGATPAALRQQPVTARLAAYQAGGQDPDLEEVLFQYGRYLLIACSRTNGLPANLQGLWNDSNSPAWHSDYHSNINIQMNYWLAEPANLPECHQPFLDLVMAMREPSRQATRAAFGPGRGWTARTSHNIFGGHGWEWNIPASAWYAQHFWEHFAFSRDLNYLRATGYPMLKEICEYWEDHLKELPDKTLVVPKGWSPEHGPREDGVAHDQQIVWDLFANTIEAAEALGVDADYRRKLTDLRDRLAGPRIGRWGQLQEWIADRDDPKDQHRHTSHLFAVYPGRQISPARTPEFALAAAKSLAARGEAGDSRRSWTWPWRCALWARLNEPENARRMVRGLLTYNVLPNLFGNHPPFQMDGNFGITAGVCEILLQSHAGQISLLPALSKEWPEGSFQGLRARGGFEVGATWQAGKPVTATLLSREGNPVILQTGVPVTAIQTEAGKAVPFTARDGRVEFKTQPNTRYALKFGQ